MTTKILIVDDHPIVRHGMAQILNQQADMQICCEAGNCEAALQTMQQCRHDLAIVDVSLRNGSGFDLIKAFVQQYPDVAILVMSMHEESLYAERALRLGAKGYLMKSQAITYILSAIRCIMAGGIYVSDDMQKLILGRIASHCSEPSATETVASLTDREFEVLRLIGLGYATKEIAETINRSVKTIESHRANIKEKLGLNSGAALLRFATFWMMERD